MDAPTDASARRRALLRTLERALYEALADSAELHRALWELQREGLHVRLSIDSDRGEVSAPANGQKVRRATRRQPTPSFRIDSDDLRFLRSIGIDPTRSRRARRRD